MAYTTLSPSGLRTTPTGDADWLANANYNFTRLNSLLLKLATLQDVNASGIANGDLLRYNAGSTKWVPWTPPRSPKTTTTSSTSTTSSSSTTTTTTTA